MYGSLKPRAVHIVWILNDTVESHFEKIRGTLILRLYVVKTTYSIMGCISSNATTESFGHDFPLQMSLVPFAKYSSFPTNTPKTVQRRNIAVSCIDSVATTYNLGGFTELILNNNCNTNSIDYKSFAIDYGKKYADVTFGGLDDAQFTHSYLIRNNKYFIVFRHDLHYNVYDMENDKWLLNQNEKTLSKNDSLDSRSVLINDEIIIISTKHQLCFYFIGGDHITDPILIKQYQLTRRYGFVSFERHGMCIIDFIDINKSISNAGDDYINDDELFQKYKYKIKIVLFGGCNEYILSSFLFLDITLSCSIIQPTRLKLSIDDNWLGKNEITLNNIDTNKVKEQVWHDFGYDCLFNSKNEAIIVIIGGSSGKVADTGCKMEKDIHLFNCKTYQLTCIKQVSYTYFHVIELMFEINEIEILMLSRIHE